MRYRFIGFGLVCVLATSPVSARYGYCEVRSFGFDKTFLSGILDFGPDSKNYMAIKSDFAGSVNRPANRVECDGSFARAHEASDYKARKIAAKLEVLEDTGWTGNYAAAEGTEKPEPSGAFISIKDNGEKARTDAWDNQVLQTQREEAARKVRIALGTAASKAEYDRIMAKVRADLKRRGRSQ